MVATCNEIAITKVIKFHPEVLIHWINLVYITMKILAHINTNPAASTSQSVTPIQCVTRNTSTIIRNVPVVPSFRNKAQINIMCI